jgi:Ras-related protein Rap-1A
MNNNSNALKVAVMGSGGVGKSAITVKFVQGIFIDKYDPTIEDSYRKQVMVDGGCHMVEILDTAGTEQFTAMRDLYIKNAEGIILVFSLLSLSSLQDLDAIKQQIENIHEDIPMVICANKCDLQDDIIISRDEYDDISAKYNSPVIETSAKTNVGIEDAFESILSTIIQNRNTVTKAKKKRRCAIL